MRKVLLPPLLAGAAVLCLLLAVTISFGQGAKTSNPLAGPTHDELAHQLAADVEGTPTLADIQRARKPLSERRRLLAAHPYFALYKIAKHRFDVSWYLVAAVHYQDTGFGEAPATLAATPAWRDHRDATGGIIRPSRYPNRSERHPSVKDDFDVVMAIAADLEARGARNLGDDAREALAARYGTGPDGRLAAAMVIERARAWRLLGTIPLPGSGELATPVKGVVGGCGYFGCPRPGHLHNGVDFLAPTGAPIHAADEGEVASVESPGESGGYGNFVCIQHRPHLASCYAHMSAFADGLKPGMHVKRGEVIGLVGSTGSSSTPHLHFEVRRGAAACSACAVDPLPMLSGDVPDSALADMVDDAPTTARTAAPTPVAAAPAPTAPVTPAPEPTADPAPPAPNRSSQAAPTTGGAVPRKPAPPYTSTTPALPPKQPTAPAPATPPAAPEPAAPQQPPPAATSEGGAVPDVSAPAPPAQEPPAPQP